MFQRMFRLRLILILGLFSEHAYGTGFLQTDGRFIVDADGNTVLLRGFGLGGWLVQEGYMWNIHGFVGSPSNIESKIIDSSWSLYFLSEFIIPFKVKQFVFQL